MPSSGSGSGTPISGGSVSGTIPDAWGNCAVPLARYAQYIRVDECAFWGVRYDGQEQFECSTFWTEAQRFMVADALTQAQQMLEDIVLYPLCPTWITGAIVDDGRFVDQQKGVGNPIVTRWKMLLEAGVRAESTLANSASVSYADADISVVGPFAATISGTDEVHVFYEDSDREITPSKITYSGGNLTIEIPRCRLVNPDLFGTITASLGIEKIDTDNFVSAVDVKRIYNDPSTNTTLVRAHACNALCLADGCTQATDTACMVIRDPLAGIVEVHPGTYANGAWGYTCSSYCYNHVRLNYLAGVRVPTRTIENVIVRLAHSLMAEEPCNCTVTQRLWMRDRNTPEVLTAERLNNPFGLSDGAWFAYRWAVNQDTSAPGSVL